MATWVWNGFTIALALATAVGATASFISPELTTIPAFLAMVLPLLLLATILAGVVNLLTVKRRAWLQGATLLLSVNTIASLCPVNYTKAAPPGAPTLKFMSFNILCFRDIEDKYPDSTNRSLTQVIQSGADIVSLQESFPLGINRNFSIYQSQIDSIEAIYPYSVYYREGTGSIHSKYPLKEIKLRQPELIWSSWVAAETVVAGDTLLLVNVHLQSIGLSEEDKENYQQFTEGDRMRGWKGKAKTLYEKVDSAFVGRARQADFLASQIDSLGYRNVILSGDFNDVAACYAIRRLGDGHMRSAFAEAGFGPMITYNTDRFYFHIDHILYEGNLRPVAFRRGNVRSSDHYPIYCTFEIL